MNLDDGQNSAYPGPAYLAIDVGGTKTLLTVFSAYGELLFKNKFPTEKKYEQFLKSLKPQLDQLKSQYRLVAACCALPGTIDRQNGLGEHFGNLPWENVPAKKDLSEMLNVPVFIENDANLAGISEAKLVEQQYKKVMYLTVSTGIKSGITVDGKLVPELADSEPGQMVLEHDGKLEKWERFASGKALVERFGKPAKDQDDPAVWAQFAPDVARGMDALMAIVQPDVIIIGGSVGNFLEKYIEPLTAELKKLQNDMVEIPPIIKAQRPEEAVVYGCFEFIKQNL
jgi:predicted NBD/HSP70 family sugar kinase